MNKIYLLARMDNAGYEPAMCVIVAKSKERAIEIYNKSRGWSKERQFTVTEISREEEGIILSYFDQS